MRSVSHTYLEEEILQANTIKLVQALYRSAIHSITKARSFLSGGQIRERSNEITRACEILTELSHGLDLERGGRLAASLGQLYDYMQRQLIEANAQQSAPHLNEVEGLLRTLLEAWDECDQKNLVAPQSSSAAAHLPTGMPRLPARAGGEHSVRFEWASKAESPANNALSLA
jgi:flagellar protein FliS